MAISSLENGQLSQLNFQELIEKQTKITEPEWKQDQKKSLESLN